MGFAGDIETLRGIPPSWASAMLPGVWTERVGLPLVLLCLEMKITSSGLVKDSVMFCAWTNSWFKVARITFRLRISAC